MSEAEPKPPMRGGHFLFGFTLAFIPLWLFSLFMLWTADGLGLGYTILFGAAYGIPGSCVAGIFTAVIADRILARRAYRPVYSRIGLALLVLIPLTVIASFFGRAVFVQVKDTVARQQYASALDDWKGDWEKIYGSRYPKGPESLLPLFGPLHYPGLQIREWKLEGFYYPVWKITAVTADPLRSVLAHFMRVLPGGFSAHSYDMPGGGGRFLIRSDEIKSADGRGTIVWIEGKKDAPFTVTFETMPFARDKNTIKGTAASLPAAWPKKLEDYESKAQAHRKEFLQNKEKILGPLRYPRADLVWGNFFNYQEPEALEYVTEDELSQVEAYYREVIGPPQKREAWHDPKLTRFRKELESTFLVSVAIAPGETGTWIYISRAN